MRPPYRSALSPGDPHGLHDPEDLGAYCVWWYGLADGTREWAFAPRGPGGTYWRVSASTSGFATRTAAVVAGAAATADPRVSPLPAKTYVVYRHDRQRDPVLTVHARREGADCAIEAFKASYGDRYTWAERDHGRARGWVRYVESDVREDGPYARIEELEVEP